MKAEHVDHIQLAKPWPLTLWLTGYSAAGKSTLASALQQRLKGGGLASFVLDGDQVRNGLCRDLGYTEADRSENIRRAAEVARLMNDGGVIVIGAFISPCRSHRVLAQQIIGPKRFAEIHVSTSLMDCEKRDPKGLYRRAKAGELRNFTGIDAPYEMPETPALALDTANLAVGECVDRMMRLVLMHRPGGL